MSLAANIALTTALATSPPPVPPIAYVTAQSVQIVPGTISAEAIPSVDPGHVTLRATAIGDVQEHSFDCAQLPPMRAHFFNRSDALREKMAHQMEGYMTQTLRSSGRIIHIGAEDGPVTVNDAMKSFATVAAVDAYIELAKVIARGEAMCFAPKP